MDPILEILQKDARTSPEDIAKMLEMKPEDVEAKIKKYEEDGVILGYKAIINDELAHGDSKMVSALIEVKVSPRKNVGFDKIAEELYSYQDISNCYLLSGTYDLLLMVEGKDIQSVSRFVAEKLSPTEDVNGTVTHFLLKKYKQEGIILKHREDTKRQAITY
ncbi:TPA: AsnC family transcriptional regulator [bacterium]|nr:MAG: hypothetical protein AUJ18_08490 [Candidatus Hydrogenedentes bacterium CG1_02_42_14]PIU48457.1 MAG: AsnC family transcriptional regulator [Candidatus Hydrogenedentes bacterium CG07_land_8_20_14_0_80_42_17]HBW47038.1 AsnC family transcriptional regulator [bacterium]